MVNLLVDKCLLGQISSHLRFCECLLLHFFFLGVFAGESGHGGGDRDCIIVALCVPCDREESFAQCYGDYASSCALWHSRNK